MRRTGHVPTHQYSETLPSVSTGAASCSVGMGTDVHPTVLSLLGPTAAGMNDLAAAGPACQLHLDGVGEGFFCE